jgi:hypothetical protein
MVIHRQNSYTLRDKQRTGRREAQSLEPLCMSILVMGSTQPHIQSLAGETDREVNRFV